jgi:hypothetical protein
MKHLLTLFFILVSSTAFAQDPCDIPDTYTNQVTVVENDLRVGFATDKASYIPSEVVQFYLVVENVGSQTFSINWGIDPQDGVFVLPTSCTALAYPGCFVDEAVYYQPTVIYYYSAGTTLEPGECRIWTHVWDPAVYGAHPAGTYNVLGGMYEAMPLSPPGAFRVPTGGVLLSLTIESAIPTKNRTWGEIKVLYD